MRILSAVAALAALVLLSGCAPRRFPPPAEQEADFSLFPSDAAVQSDDALARILAREWSAPARARLAVVRVGQRSPYYGWSDEFARLDGQVRADLLGALLGSARVATAAELPSLLVPRQQTVGQLREAAARFRSDLLLVWRGDCRSYQRQRLFSADESRAHCDVEAVLLDVRTGLAPFAASASKEFFTREARGELSVYEAARRAELQATGDALLEVGRAVKSFLEGPPPSAR